MGDSFSSSTSSTDTWWTHLSPALRAAITVAVVVILLEILSDMLPAVGFILTLPFAIAVYYVQGLLVGWYLKNDPRYPAAGPGLYLGSGALSAFWTGVVISGGVTLIDTAILTPLTLGAVLAAIPLVLGSSLVDMVLNFFFTILGAWLYRRFNNRGLLGVSCALLGLVMACLCLAGAALAGAIIFGGVSLFRHLPGILGTARP
jgi:hypothetical protein